jgi:ABC-2 type transport system permease protein
MVLAGLMLGSVIQSMVDLIKGFNVPIFGGGSLTAFVGFLLSVVGLMSLMLPMQLMTGLRADEARGLTESQLAGGLSRCALVLGRLVVAFVVAALLLILGGASFGLTYGASVGDMSQLWRLAADALVYLPGIMAVVGVSALLFGFAPRLTISVSWALATAMYFHVIISDALNLPDWVNNILPFTGTPMLPYEEFNASVFWFAAAAIVLLALGILGFRRRDVPK